MSNNHKEKEEEKEIIKPGAGMKRHWMMDSKDTKLEHPRKVLWRWLFSYLSRYKLKFVAFLILLLIGTLITSFTPVISSSIVDKGMIAMIKSSKK